MVLPLDAELPDASAVTARGARPWDGETLRTAVGALVAGATLTVRVAEADCPAVSVTVTVAENVPPLVYVWVAVAADWGPSTGEPSPKSKVYDAIGLASLSVDADASAVTPTGAVPDVVATVRAGVGGWS